jgi:hypothetical protein
MAVVISSHTGSIGQDRTGHTEAEVGGQSAAIRFYVEIMVGYTAQQVMASAEMLYQYWMEKYPKDTRRQSFAGGFREMAYVIAQARL